MLETFQTVSFIVPRVTRWYLKRFQVIVHTVCLNFEDHLRKMKGHFENIGLLSKMFLGCPMFIALQDLKLSKVGLPFVETPNKFMRKATSS